MGTARFWKRGHLLTDAAGRLGVAGAFSRSPVPVVVDTDRGHWFNAHVHKTGAHRYRPFAAALLQVEFTDPTFDVPGYVQSRTQTLCHIELGFRCGMCRADREPKLGTVRFDSAWDEVVAVCDDHATDGEHGELTGRLAEIGVTLSWRTPGIQRFYDMRELAVPGGCACERVEVLLEHRGLAWYLRDLWSDEGGDSHRRLMACRACGTEWTYHRGRLPVFAVKNGARGERAGGHGPDTTAR